VTIDLIKDGTKAMEVSTVHHSGTISSLARMTADEDSVPGGKVVQAGVVLPITMNEPAMLYRRTADAANPERRAWETIIARGPFIVMAAGYLAFDPEHRTSFSIRTETREVMPDEIEEAVQEWNAGKQRLASGF
jgi:hypothetical protein